MLMNAILRCAALAVVLATPVYGEDVVLTVSGDVAPPRNGDAWTFDMAQLRALPSASFTTTTIWTEGPQTFEGVPLNALLKQVGAADGSIEAIALNDYAVTIPTSDATEGGPIIAYNRNGSPLSVRDKGPLWIIYPFDDNSSYKSEEYYSRSIWQLDRLKVTAKK